MKSSDYWFRKAKIDIAFGIFACLTALFLIFLIHLIFNIAFITMGGIIGGAIIGSMTPSLLDARESYKNGKKARKLEQQLTEQQGGTKL